MREGKECPPFCRCSDSTEVTLCATCMTSLSVDSMLWGSKGVQRSLASVHWEAGGVESSSVLP